VQVAFWNKEIETADRRTLEQIQLKRLRETVDWAVRTPFYQRRLDGIGIRSGQDVRALDDLQRIPFTVKDDLRTSFPHGLLAVDRRAVVRIHSSSGTTGIPTVIYYTADDLDRWTDLIARSIVATGPPTKTSFRT